MLLERNLIKSVIILAYILYRLKKYTSGGCANIVVLERMIFKSRPYIFSPKASSSNCSSLCPDQEPQSTSEFVDKCGFKSDRKTSTGVLTSSSHLRLVHNNPGTVTRTETGT